MTDLSSPGGHLVKSRCPKISPIHRHHRRTLCAPVSLQGPNAKLVLEGQSDTLLQLLSPDQNILQRAKVLWRAAPHISLQKGRSGNQKSDLLLLHQPTNHLCIQRIGMENNAYALDRRQPQARGKPEGMEEWQDAKNPVAPSQ